MQLIKTPIPKSKKRHRNAEAAKRAKEDEAAWQALLKRHASKKVAPAKTVIPNLRGVLAFQASLGRIAPTPGSRPDPVTETKPFTTKPTRYTGDAVLGIADTHKSNAVPVMRDNPEYAKEIARMRR